MSRKALVQRHVPGQNRPTCDSLPRAAVLGHSRPLCMNCNNNNNNNSRSSSSTVLGVIIHNDDDDRFLRKVHKLFKVLLGGGGSRGSALGVRSLTACAINQ